MMKLTVIAEIRFAAQLHDLQGGVGRAPDDWVSGERDFAGWMFRGLPTADVDNCLTHPTMAVRLVREVPESAENGQRLVLHHHADELTGARVS